MPRFSETLIDHFESPRNRYRLDQPDAVGTASISAQGRSLTLYLKCDSERITKAAAECCGCGVTIACGSVLTELVTGRTCDECWRLTAAEIAQALDGIPPDKMDRASFAIHALHEALMQLSSPSA